MITFEICRITAKMRLQHNTKLSVRSRSLFLMMSSKMVQMNVGQMIKIIIDDRTKSKNPTCSPNICPVLPRTI